MKSMILSSSILLTFALAGHAKAEMIGGICSTGGQNCDAAALYSFESTDESDNGHYIIRIQAPRTHCSPVRYVILTGDGRLSWGATNWLEAGQTGILRIGVPLAIGTQVVQVKAIGKRGGCNMGTLGSWKANIDSYWQED